MKTYRRPDDKNNIGRIIREARLKTGLSQMALSMKVHDFEKEGSKPHNIAVSWENGAQKVKQGEIPKLLEALGLPEDTFEPYMDEIYVPAIREKYGKRVDPEINKRIKQAREMRGMTQRDMAKLLDIFPSHYNKIESNATNPTIEQARVLIKYFGWDWDYYMEGGSTGRSMRALEKENQELKEKLVKMERDMEIIKQAAAIHLSK
jgi:transcriptional regulator with XRE-family HTH domain